MRFWNLLSVFVASGGAACVLAACTSASDSNDAQGGAYIAGMPPTSGTSQPGSTGGAPGGSEGMAMGGSPTNTTGGAAGTTGGSPSSSTGGAPMVPPADTSGECSLSVEQAPVCCAPMPEQKAFIDEVFRLLNEYRVSQGRAELSYDPKLEAAMQGHCVHMAQADFFAHEAPIGALKEPWDRAKLCGTAANGENIAYNQATPAAVMQTWKESAGHNANMLSANFKRVGIGYYQRRWGQLFGR